MKTFHQHLEEENEAYLADEALLNKLEGAKDICQISLKKLRSGVMRTMWISQCGGTKKEKDSAIRKAAKRAGMLRGKRDTLYNEKEK